MKIDINRCGTYARVRQASHLASKLKMSGR